MSQNESPVTESQTEQIQPRRSQLRVFRSGEWRSHPQMTDYRSEWLSDLLVERATWRHDADIYKLGGIEVARPQGIWFRFWLPEQQQLVDKYFNEDGSTIGLYMPITDPIQRGSKGSTATHLVLGVWLTPQGHMTVIGEELFDAAVKAGLISKQRAIHAETRIRELNAEISKERMPPTLIRNFSIDLQRG
jgi:predicted RNA-binding protein associated with RNAse of E/G family